MNKKVLQQIKKNLESLRNSCHEGLDGVWDCTTDEGREGFSAMVYSCHKIAELLKIELDEYEHFDEDEDV